MQITLSTPVVITRAADVNLDADVVNQDRDGNCDWVLRRHEGKIVLKAPWASPLTLEQKRRNSKCSRVLRSSTLVGCHSCWITAAAYTVLLRKVDTLQ